MIGLGRMGANMTQRLLDGTLVPSEGVEAPDGWFYKRVWEVVQADTNLKEITVTTTVTSAVGGVGRVPSTTVKALKTYPF